jgi:hypothetical protein
MSFGEDEIWESWKPGGKASSSFVVIVDSIVDQNSAIVTPVVRFRDLRSKSAPALPLGAVGGLLSGDPMVVRDYGRKRNDKQFVLVGVPTESYFPGQVLYVSGEFSIDTAVTTGGDTLIAATATHPLRNDPIQNGDNSRDRDRDRRDRSRSGRERSDPRLLISPAPRDIEADIVFEDHLHWKSWRPRMIGRVVLVGKVQLILGESSATIVPLNTDDGSMSQRDKNELSSKSPPSDTRIKELCRSAYDRSFKLDAIDTNDLVDGALIRLDGIFFVDRDDATNLPVVHQLRGRDEEVAIRRIRFSKEKQPITLTSGDRMEIVAESIEKGNDGEFHLHYIAENGEVEDMQFDNLNSASQSAIRKVMAQRRKDSK